jgi:hypothetical protein
VEGEVGDDTDGDRGGLPAWLGMLAEATGLLLILPTPAVVTLLPLVLVSEVPGITVESYSGPWSTAGCVWSCGTDTKTCPVHVPELLPGLASAAV